MNFHVVHNLSDIHVGSGLGLRTIKLMLCSTWHYCMKKISLGFSEMSMTIKNM